MFIVMTNRPERLDIDLKRAGRLDVKVPFFSPQTLDDVEAVVQALARKHGLSLMLQPEELRDLLRGLVGYAGADLEALLLLAAEDEALTGIQLQSAIADYIPTRDRDMIRYMELLAVFECSSRRLLPDNYRDRSTEDLQNEMNQLRQRVAGRY